MSEHANDKEHQRPTLLERLSAFLIREPEDREELLALLHGAFERVRAALRARQSSTPDH